MTEVNAEELKRVIQSQHGGSATYCQSVRVSQAHGAPSEWDGLVHVFDLKGNPKANRAYAWSSPILGGTRPRMFAVLHMGRVTGPIEAVKAAAAAINKWGPKGVQDAKR